MRRLRGVTDSVNSRRITSWRAALLPAGLVLVVVALSGTGFGGWRLLQSVKRRSLIQHCRDQGQILSDRLLEEVRDRNRESLADVAATASFAALASNVVDEHTGIVYLHLVEPGGRIAWSSEPSRVSKEWWGGHPGEFTADEQKGGRPLKSLDPRASFEVVVPTREGPVKGAIVL